MTATLDRCSAGLRPPDGGQHRRRIVRLLSPDVAADVADVVVPPLREPEQVIVTRRDSPVGSDESFASSARREHLHEPPSLLTPEPVLHRLSDDLAHRFAGVFSPETVEPVRLRVLCRLERSARIPTHLPVLTQRFATDRLTALAQSCGAIAKDVCEVLFVCVHNAGRSQIAAALLDHHGGGRVHVRSAGSAPTASISPADVDAMAEVGVDITREFPKPLTDDEVRAADVIVTMGCGDACPVYPGKRYLDWVVGDPEGRPLAEVRAIRSTPTCRHSSPS